MSSWEGWRMTEKPSEAVGQDDPIVTEVRAARDALFAQANYDLEELGRRLRAEQGTSQRSVISRPARRVRKSTAV